MFSIFLYECKGIIREYKASFNITFHKVLFFLMFFMFSTLIFYILKVVGANELFLLNIGFILSILLGFGLKKDLYQDYLRSEKSLLLNIFPRSKLILLLLKGLKYEIIVLFEILVVLFSILVSMMLSGSNILLLTFYLLIYCLSFLVSRNFVLILTSNALIDSNILNFIKLIFKSIVLAVLLLIFGKLAGLFEYIAGFSTLNIFDGESIQILYFLKKFLFNPIKINVILILFTLLIFSYTLKIICYSFYFNKVKVSNNKDSYIFKKIFLRNENDMLYVKEYNLLHKTGIIKMLYERIFVHTIAFILLCSLNQIINLNFKISQSLILIVIFSEISNFMGTYSKTSIGYERKYIIQYILSGFNISDLLLVKSKIIVKVLSLISIYAYILLSILFDQEILHSLIFLPIIYTFILIYAIVANYNNAYKTSYSNKFMIPHKFAAIKTIIIMAILSYFDITAIFLFSLLFGQGLSNFLILIICLIHVGIYIFLKRKTKSTSKEFYGEYSDAIN